MMQVLGSSPGGDQPGRDLAGVVRKLSGILWHGDRVQIDDAINAVVLPLHRDPILDRAEVVAEVQIAGRLYAGKNPLHVRNAPPGARLIAPPRGAVNLRSGLGFAFRLVAGPRARRISLIVTTLKPVARAP